MEREDRYCRQRILSCFGHDGQERLSRGSVLVLGCGGLGCGTAQLLARAGVGKIVLADRDVVEWDNLHRQVLFDEADARAGLGKAETAARHLVAMNSVIDVEWKAEDVTRANVESLVSGVDLVCDGTDNVETRYLLNEACLTTATPWIYAGVVEAVTVVMPVLGDAGACFRCVFPDPPQPGVLTTCDASGVLNAAVSLGSSLQAVEGIRYLTGGQPDWGSLLEARAWEGTFTHARVAQDPDCPACGRREWAYLTGQDPSWAVKLCGRDSIQITPAQKMTMPLDEIALRLGRTMTVMRKGEILSLGVGPEEILLFPDGRAIVKGTSDKTRARTLYDKYVGG